MYKEDRTIEQRLDRLERLDGETQERLSNIERLVGLIADDPVLGRQKKASPQAADDTHRGSRKVDPHIWRWPEW